MNEDVRWLMRMDRRNEGMGVRMRRDEDDGSEMRLMDEDDG